MSNLIEELTLAQGIDPREAPVIAGGGGCGLYAVAIARRIGSPYVVIPPLAATLSAAGALMSDLRDHYAKTTFTMTGRLDFVAVNETLEELERAAEAFAAGPGAGARETTISFSVEARYPFQVWEIPLPLRTNRIRTEDDAAQVREDFHTLHQEIFAIQDTSSEVELVTWSAHVSCRLRDDVPSLESTGHTTSEPSVRESFFFGHGSLPTNVYRRESLEAGAALAGPALIEGQAETVVVPPGATIELLPSGSLRIEPAARENATAEDPRMAAA
jgi:N-methylhydantoinase A